MPAPRGTGWVCTYRVLPAGRSCTARLTSRSPSQLLDTFRRRTQDARVPSPSPQDHRHFFTHLERRELQDTSPEELSSIPEGGPCIPPTGVTLSDSPARKSDPTGARLFPSCANRVGGAHMNFHPSSIPSPHAGVRGCPAPHLGRCVGAAGGGLLTGGKQSRRSMAGG